MMIGFKCSFCGICQAARYPLSLLSISPSTIVVMECFSSSVDRKYLPSCMRHNQSRTVEYGRTMILQMSLMLSRGHFNPIT